MALLHQELRHYDYHSVVRCLHSIPASRVVLAIALTALSYALLTGYDILALRQVGRSPGYPRTALASFTAYVLSYNVGVSLVSGTAVRFRLYGAWGYTTGEIARIVAFTGSTFWLGLFAVAGGLFAGGRAALPSAWFIAGGNLRVIGAFLLLVVVSYLVLCALRRRPLVIGGWAFPLPRWRMALAQLLLGSADVTVAGLVLWVLMPSGWPDFPGFLGLYLLSMTAGVISHVPGGLGVTETVMLYGRPEAITAPEILGALLAFRVVYYLIPLGGALALLATHEGVRQRDRLRGIATEASRWVPRIAPGFFAITTFLAGGILLVSGATPSGHERMAWLASLLPLPVMEFSHLFGSVVGVLLLFLARGLQRRMDAAYGLTLGMLGAGAVFSLLKGFDWKEAMLLLAMLGVMLPCRAAFHRRASLFEARFTPGWIVAIVLVLTASGWLGFFAHRHVEYRDELWWQFAVRGDAPRFLRASVGALAVVLILGVRLLLRPRVMRTLLPDAAAIERVVPIVRASPESTAHLALVGDKALLLNDRGNGFIMYAVAGRSWVALGGPVGSSEDCEALVWAFRELADQRGGWSVFYQVGAANLPVYLDAGLTLTKLGEEARVALAGFSLDGGNRKGLRQTVRKVETDGAVFCWIEPAGVPEILPQLRRVSDAWLAERNTREKGFSLGCFREDYLKRGPMAIVRRAGAIVAFANVWCSADKEELSVDLMRYNRDAPRDVMEYLFIQLILRGAREGYAWFNLGMAPMSGLENRALAPTWHRLGAMLFQHGEHLYRFQGLRAFKEKFRPTWAPRYLAAPGGLQMPIILANVATLISGGAKGLVTK